MNSTTASSASEEAAMTGIVRAEYHVLAVGCEAGHYLGTLRNVLAGPLRYPERAGRDFLSSQ